MKMEGGLSFSLVWLTIKRRRRKRTMSIFLLASPSSIHLKWEKDDKNKGFDKFIL